MIAIDHVIVTTGDARAFAAELRERTGLAAVEGGRHPGHGTGNHLVPLGDAYLELMEVVDEDEARTSPLGSWVLGRPQHGLALVCLRTDDADAVAARLDRQPVAMSRATPAGDELRWRLVGLDDALGAEQLPFFIEWEVAAAAHPGRQPAPHDTAPVGITDLQLGGDVQRLSGWIGPHEMPVRLMGGRPGPRAVTIATSDGPVRISPSGLD